MGQLFSSIMNSNRETVDIFLDFESKPFSIIWALADKP